MKVPIKFVKININLGIFNMKMYIIMFWQLSNEDWMKWVLFSGTVCWQSKENHVKETVERKSVVATIQVVNL